MGQRKNWLFIFVLFTLLLIGFIYYLMINPRHEFNDSIYSARSRETTLTLPTVLEDLDPDPNIEEFSLIAQTGMMEFFERKQTETFGYNSDYLGPVIRANKGQQVNVKVKNELGETTTVHWHGLEVSGEFDGGPHTEIVNGAINPHVKV